MNPAISPGAPTVVAPPAAPAPVAPPAVVAPPAQPAKIRAPRAGKKRASAAPASPAVKL